MKNRSLDLNSQKIFLEAGEAIEFIEGLGLEIRISEGQLDSFFKDIWVATATITGQDKKPLAQGLSLGGGDRYRARSLAIFEALESLFFYSYIQSTSIQGLDIFDINKSLYFTKSRELLCKIENPSNELIQKKKVRNSTGWALGSTIESACMRAAHEVIEREIRDKIEELSSSMIRVNTLAIDYGAALNKIALDRNYQLSSVIIKIENDITFSISVMRSSENNKTFLGTSAGQGDVTSVVRKSLEEVAMGFYFSVIVNQEEVGKPTDEFNYSNFSKIYDSLSSDIFQPDSDSNLFYDKIIPVAARSDFTFRLFPVQNRSTIFDLFVAQAL